MNARNDWSFDPESGPYRSADGDPTTAEMAIVGGSATYVGRVAGGRYRVGRQLGEGGMGGVYEAEHLELGKRVAIKIVHALHARDPLVAARIRQEARSTGAIESEHIVEVFDAGDDDELGIYLVMELLRGQDLSALLRGGRRVPPVAAATMALQAALGLSRAHAAGIIHRDLKPANVFLSTRDDGRSIVKLVDFGIAKLVRDARRGNEGAALTQAGMAIGTPHYMSPEQAQGLATVDHRTDVYSLGAVLFEAIAGAPAFPQLGSYEQTIVNLVTTRAPRLSSFVPDIDPRLDQLCADMLARDPDARPEDMGAVRDRLLVIFPEIEHARLEILADGDGVLIEAIPPTSRVISAMVSRSGSARAARTSLPPPVSFPSVPPILAAAEPVVEGVYPLRRRGAPFFVATVTLALATLICVLALFKVHGPEVAPPTTTSFGIVESAVSVAPVPEPVLLPAPSSAAGAPSAPATGTASADEAPAPTPLPLATSRPARKKAPKKDSSGPLVGGTTESTEF